MLEIFTLLLTQAETIDGSVASLFDAVKTGGALAISVGVIQLLVFIGKKLNDVSPVIKRYGKIIVLVLSAVLAVLSSVAGGLVWYEALVVFAGSAGTAFVHDLIGEIGVLTKKG